MADWERAGAKLHYETVGASGPWLTLINGHNRPLNDFRMMARFFGERGWRVLSLDNRGSGLTTSAAGFTLADMQADVAGLWDHEGISESAVLGISMGGFIAAGLATSEETAARVTRLILVSTALRASWIIGDALPWSGDVAATETKLRPYFTAEFAERNQVLVRSMAKQIAKSVASGDFLERSAAQRLAIGRCDLRGKVGLARAPVLVVHGERDEVIPVGAAEETWELLKASREGEAEGGRLAIVKGVGHLLLAEAPKELYRMVGEFLWGEEDRGS